VQLSFEPLVMGVRPGGKLLLAAHFRIASGYRISWKASGEVGQPTTVTFSAPPGFDVGPVQFPAPVRFTVPGGYTGLGYENETAIFVEVKAPGALGRDAVSRFDLDATWVACRRICATEHTAAYVELATTYGDARARDVEASVAPYRARVPVPLASLTDSDASWDTKGRNAVLTVKLPGATPKEFFSDGTADPKPTKTTMSDGELRFVFEEAAKAGDKPLRGVVVASIDGKEAYYDVEAPIAGIEPEKAEKKGKPAKATKATKVTKRKR
jgi:thiol:disulfide interchange protein DsbD